MSKPYDYYSWPYETQREWDKYQRALEDEEYARERVEEDLRRERQATRLRKENFEAERARYRDDISSTERLLEIALEILKENNLYELYEEKRET
jgi:hypothetical protein